MSLKISIITPNYNYGHFIGQTIESILNQNYDNIEHIIVDDGSTDNSVEIIGKFVEKYPGRIKLIRQTNKGQTRAINVGLRHAQGDIVGWINSDDLYQKDAIGKIMEECNKSQECNIVFGDLSIIDKNGKIIRLVKQLPMDKTVGSLKGFGKLVASNTVFWRTDLMAKTGLLNEEFICNMDGEYFSRLFHAGKSKHINTCISSFRVHPSSISSEVNPEKTK